MVYEDCRHYGELAPEENKERKPTKKAAPSKRRVSPPLVNRCLNHPDGAYRWHRLYDSALCEFIPELYERGESDAEVASSIGISKKTFYVWMSNYPEFKSAVECGRTQAECIFQIAGREASLGHRDINSRVWEINMRNRYDFDKPKENTNELDETDKEISIKKATEGKLPETTNDY